MSCFVPVIRHYASQARRHVSFYVLKNKNPDGRGVREGNRQNELSTKAPEPLRSQSQGIVFGQRLADTGKTPHLQRAEVRITAPHRAAVVIMQVKTASKCGYGRHAVFKINRRLKLAKKLARLLIRLAKRAVIVVIINPPHIKHAMAAYRALFKPINQCQTIVLARFKIEKPAFLHMITAHQLGHTTPILPLRASCRLGRGNPQIS